jgi:prepilin-type N-terminal cleavage/methylation domain-containing protein
MSAPILKNVSQSGRRGTRGGAGFTLVELLVVIAIIGVLVALLLPAIQAAREAARRTSCVNNISQLGLAVHNYEFTHEMLPAGVVNPEGPIRSEPEGIHVSWLVQILPYLEQRNAYQQFDQAAGAYAQANAPVRKLTMGIMVCPSYPGAEKNEEETAGVTTYAGCHHDREEPIDADNHGALILNGTLRYSDLLDGSSQTLLVGEMFPAYNTLGWVSGTRATLRNASSINAVPWREVGVRPGNFPRGDREQPVENPLTVGGFASSHPGGAEFAFADGSARFVTEDIKPEILAQLGHRADGKLLDEVY